MKHSAEFLRCMAELDVPQARRLFAVVMPHLPQPASDDAMLVQLHMARTQCPALSDRARFYSYRWLSDRGLPDQLPDHMRPAAERMFPKITDAVGIACGASSELLRPVALEMRGAMSDVVLEHYADGEKNPDIIRPRMLEARRKVQKAVGLLWSKHRDLLQ